MEIRNQTILILGGSGLVGEAVARKLLVHRPAKIVLVALLEHEVRTTLERLTPVSGDTTIDIAWGNVFLPADVARRTREELLADASVRASIIGDLFDTLDDEILQRSFLFQLLDQHKPAAVVDCINTATAFAYQDVFKSARGLLAAARAGVVTEELVEQHLLTLTMPQLIRHVQIALGAMRRTGTETYVKIGTSGTGGMGLNIPYTHSEERPSPMLLTKAAVAGAHSLLLFLMARTPGSPSAHEIKPTAAIGWREIAFGPIMRRGRPLQRFDCPEPLELSTAFDPQAAGWVDCQTPLESAYIDLGENGVFAHDEFETVTALKQMEFITAEEVGDYVVMEMQGRSTGRDIVAALDGATAGPTYNAGVLRAAALERLSQLKKEHNVQSVAFEMLGPPRLTKTLYEAMLLGRIHGTVRDLATSKAEDVARALESLVAADDTVRSTIISVGLPILTTSGRVYRGKEVLLPPDGSSIDMVVARGWVDLRVPACARWIDRAQQVIAQVDQRPAMGIGSGSGEEWDEMTADGPISPPKFAKWIFRYEEDAERIKR